MRSVVLALGLVLLSGCTGTEVPPRVAAMADEAAGAVAPTEGDVLVEGDFSLTAAFVRDAAAAGDGAVVNLFGSWCTPCERELPLLLEVSRTTPDVRWLGVAVQDLPEPAREFVDRLEVWWPTVRDEPGDTYDALQGLGMPTTAFFDADGELVAVVTGELDRARLTEELERITP